jgi:gamma-butyrobetaine dioxygenase
MVHVAWADGTRLACYALWLYENSVAIDPVTRESVVDPASLPPDDELTGAERSSDGGLRLSWEHGAPTIIHPGWLYEIAVAGHLPAAVPGPPRRWTAAELSEPPDHDGSRVLGDDAVLEAWVTDLCRFGITRLRGGGVGDRGFMRSVADRLGPIRGSNFGDVFTVEARIDADSTANTGLALGQHTDLPTRETPPGFQFLHCVENSVPGGESRITDGLAVVREIRDVWPDAYTALTTLEWVFANRARDGDHRWTGPIIDDAGGHRPLTLRGFYPVRLAPHMDPAEAPAAYEALRVFSRVAHDPRFMMRFRMDPGDLVGFDNRRVLHGRDAFDPGSGSRILVGCYIDHDDVFSRLRVLHRDRPGVSFSR